MKTNLLKKNAKSFYWASFFLSNDVFDKCSSLYNFCRTLDDIVAVSYTHLRAHETKANLVCRLLLEKKKNHNQN